MSTRQPRSFLYDDYMDNTMYTDASTYDSIPRSRRFVKQYEDLDQVEDEVVVRLPRAGRGATQKRSSRPADPIYGADGSVFSVPRGHARPHGSGRPMQSSRTADPIYGADGSVFSVPRGHARTRGAYTVLDKPRRRPVARPRVTEEIIEVCSTVFLPSVISICNNVFFCLVCD
jgi:hypothetical protein